MIPPLWAATLAAWLCWTPLQAQEPELQAELERAQHLSVTEAVPASQPVIDALMDRLEEATPYQRIEIELLDIRNLALQGDYDGAIDRLEGLLDTIGDTGQRLRALGLAANLGINSQRFEWGYTQLKAALELVPEGEDLVEQSNILSLAGFTHSMFGDHLRGTRYARQALTIAEEADSVSQRCRAGQRLTVAYRYAEQLDRAEAVAREALRTCREVDDQVYLGTVELEMAYFALARNDIDAAERWARQGLERLRTAVWADGIVTGESLLARIAAARGRHREAIDRARPLVDQVDRRRLWLQKSELLLLIATELAELEEFTEAFRTMEAHNEARQRFLDEDRARRLAILEVEFDVQRQEQELQLLREQQRVAELQAQSRRQQVRVRWMTYGFALFLFMILALLLIHVLRERRHYRRLSELDSLTRVSNHTRFFDTARMLVEESRRRGKPLVLALGDIDHFKQVNDEHGHIAGDKALREVARVLCDSFPGLGHVGRIGGEEFAVCVPDSETEPVLRQLEQVRENLAKIQYGGNGKPLTMSFGVAELAAGEALENLRKRADEALYEAKSGGRNSVVVAKGKQAD